MTLVAVGGGGGSTDLSVCFLVWLQMLIPKLIFGALVSMNAKGNDCELSFKDAGVVSLTFSCSASSGMTCVGNMRPALFSAVGNYVRLTQFVF